MTDLFLFSWSSFSTFPTDDWCDEISDDFNKGDGDGDEAFRLLPVTSSRIEDTLTAKDKSFNQGILNEGRISTIYLLEQTRPDQQLFILKLYISFLQNNLS
jgi:hypothetical protein